MSVTVLWLFVLAFHTNVEAPAARYPAVQRPQHPVSSGTAKYYYPSFISYHTIIVVKLAMVSLVRSTGGSETRPTFYTRQPNASRVLAMAYASVCSSVRPSVSHTLESYQNGAS